jgi:hypothetical protein
MRQASRTTLGHNGLRLRRVPQRHGPSLPIRDSFANVSK